MANRVESGIYAEFLTMREHSRLVFPTGEGIRKGGFHDSAHDIVYLRNRINTVN